MEEKPENLVELLDNGDVKFSGRIVSSDEFLVGTVLCGLKSKERVDEPKESTTAEQPTIVSDVDSNPSTTSTFQTNFVETKKRRISKPIKLPDDDIRHNYIKDWVNAINSGDIGLYSETLRRLCLPNVVLLSKKNNPTPDYAFPAHLEIVGVDANIQVTKEYFRAMPDMMMEVIDSRINVFKNGESSIECEYVLSGSKMFVLEGLAQGSTDKITLKSATPDDLTRGLKGMTLGTKIIADVESEEGNTVTVPVKVGERQQKAILNTSYKITMHLNADKKVYLIILVAD